MKSAAIWIGVAVATVASIVAITSAVNASQFEKFNCERANAGRAAYNELATTVRDSLRTDIALRSGVKLPGDQQAALDESVERDKENLEQTEFLTYADCEDV